MGEEAGMGEGKEPLDRRDQLRKLIAREVSCSQMTPQTSGDRDLRAR